jgi:hypothetical protein
MRSEPVPTAQYFRDQAARIRIDAARFTDEMNRQQLLNIAAQYDALAESIDAHAQLGPLRRRRRPF